MGVYRGETCFLGGILRLAASMLFVVSSMVAQSVAALDSDPLILFNHESNGALVYSYFDTADPGMAYPIDIAPLPNVDALNTLGIFNGVLYVRERDGKLGGIDLGSGEKLGLNTPLSDRYVQEGSMIYALPGDANPEAVQMIDLRGPFARTVKLPSASGTPHKAFYATDDKLRYFYCDGSSELNESATANEVEILQCTVEDLRSPELPLLRLSATVQAAGQNWRIELPHWTFPGRVDPNVALVRHPPQFERLPFTWIGQNSFGCVALAVDVEGVTWEGKGDGGPSLFVVNLQTRTGRVLPLSTLPIRESLDPRKGGPDPNWYVIDSKSMTLLDQNDPNKAEEVEVLSEHFKLSRMQGPMQVLHGAQPLEMNREQNVSQAEVDASGERVLVKFPRVSVCYDIYNGYYAECVSLNCLRFVDRNELHRVEAVAPANWAPLLQQPVQGLPEGAVVPVRRDRASAYQITAVPSQSSSRAGEMVSFQIKLTYIGEGEAWTDVPASDFPILSGTLAGPDGAVVLSKLPGLTRRPPVVPVYIGPGGVLTSTLEFIPEVPGNYTLALSYGGNPESEWFGRAKAPLISFAVGERGEYVFDSARLRSAIEDFINRRGGMEDKFFEELQAAGDEGADLLAQVLLETRMPRIYTGRDFQAHMSSLLLLYDFLRERCSPRHVPFYEKLLTSDDRNVKNQGLAGIRALHKDSKEPEFRSRLEVIVRDAYSDDEATWRSGAQRDLGVVLWPDQSIK